MHSPTFNSVPDRFIHTNTPGRLSLLPTAFPLKILPSETPRSIFQDLCHKCCTDLCWLLSLSQSCHGAPRCRPSDPSSLSSAAAQRRPAAPWTTPTPGAGIKLTSPFHPLRLLASQDGTEQLCAVCRPLMGRGGGEELCVMLDARRGEHQSPQQGLHCICIY